MRKIGYARVSTQEQNLARQIAALRAEGCDRIYREKASGKSTRNRPELEKAIDMLGTRDVLVLAEWDRATRSLMDGIEIMRRIHERGALVKVLDKPGLDLTTPTGRGILALLSGLAEEDRERIMRRANEGRRLPRSWWGQARQEAQPQRAPAAGGPAEARGRRELSADREDLQRQPCHYIEAGIDFDTPAFTRTHARPSAQRGRAGRRAVDCGRKEQAMVTKAVDREELRVLRGTKRTCQNADCGSRFYEPQPRSHHLSYLLNGL